MSQSGIATTEIVKEQLAECAAFRAVTPKLSYLIREIAGGLKRNSYRTMWLSTEEIEFFDDTGALTATIPLDQSPVYSWYLQKTSR